jgi:hypothetical protein
MNKIKNVLEEMVVNKEEIRQRVKEQANKKGGYIMKKMTSIAAAVVITLGVGAGGYLAYATPINYWGVDINPSVQLGSNIFDRVVEVTALNEDAEVLLADLDLSNEEVDSAVTKIVDEATETGYIDELSEDNAVLITAYSDDEEKGEEVQTKIEEKVKKLLEDKNIKATIIKEKMTEDLKADASSYGISNGKMLLVQRAVAANPDLKAEDLVKAPVKDIMREIKYAKDPEKQEKDEAKEELKQEKEELKSEYKESIEERKEAIAEKKEEYKNAKTEEEKKAIKDEAVEEEKEKLGAAYGKLTQEEKKSLIKVDDEDEEIKDNEDEEIKDDEDEEVKDDEEEIKDDEDEEEIKDGEDEEKEPVLKEKPEKVKGNGNSKR